MIRLVVSILTGSLQAQARRRAIILGLAAVAALLALIAMGYGLGALHVWLAARYDAIVASLVFGGGFLVFALGFAVAALIVARRPPPPDPAAALTGALAPMALALAAEWLKPRGEELREKGRREAENANPGPEEPQQSASARAAETQATGATPQHGGAGVAALVLVPAVVVGLLIGRRLRG